MRKIMAGVLAFICVFNIQFCVAFAAPAARSQVLMLGDKDEWVTELQQALFEKEYLKQKPTGYFGTNTQAALILFQKEAKLTADGKAGPLTRQKLLGDKYKALPETRMAADPVESTALRAGDRGEEVTKAQKRLKELGYYTYPSFTGYFGPTTKDAVIRFQKAMSLGADGVIGEKTSKLLYSTEAQSDVFSKGDRDDEIKKIQDRLKTLKYFNSTSTGYFGPITETAVKSFQKAHGLSQDGKVGEKTSAMLFANTAKVNTGAAATTTTTNTTTNTSTRATKFINVAKGKMGAKYVLGAEGPSTFDCSGFVYYSLKNAGYSIGRMSSASYSKVSSWTTIKSMSALKPGDLVFYRSTASSAISHVSIYIGGGKILHSVPSKGGVSIATMTGYWSKNFKHGKRIF